MSDSRQVWEAWRLSKTYHCRPSDLYGVEHPVQAFFFDRAIWLFGTTLDSDLEKAAAKAKKATQAEKAQLRVMQKWLGHEAIGFGAAPTRPTRTI